MRSPGVLYLYHSFGSFGLGIVLPQAWFQLHRPESVYSLLPLCLVLGALAALTGRTLAVRAFAPAAADTSRTAAGPLVGCAATFGAAAALLWWSDDALVFMALFVAMKLAAQGLLTLADRRCVAFAGAAGVPAHSRRVAVFDIAGVVAAPLFFAVAHRSPGLVSAGVGALALAGCALAFRLGAATGPAPPPPAAAALGSRPRSPTGLPARHFLAYAFLMLSATWILSTQLVPLIGGWYGLPGPVTGGAVLLGLMNLAAVGAVLAVGRLAPSGAAPPLGLRSATHLGLSLTAVGLTLLLLGRLSVSYPYLGALGIAAGAVYGLFQAASREAASHFAVAGEAAVLDGFNDLPNYALLAASATVFLVDRLQAAAGVGGPPPAAVGILAFFGAAALFAAAVAARGASSDRALLRASRP